MPPSVEFRNLLAPFRNSVLCNLMRIIHSITYHVGDTYLCVLIYVDDLLITSNSLPVITKFKAFLSTIFNMKDLGTLKYFIGFEVACNAKGIYLCQQKYYRNCL